MSAASLRALRLVPLVAVAVLPLHAQQPVTPPPAPPAASGTAAPDDARLPPADDLRAAGRIIGLELSDAELDLMRRGVGENLGSLQALRDDPLENSEPPATVFSVLLPGIVPHVQPPRSEPWPQPNVSRPAQLEDLAFADIDTLGALLRSRQVTCVELTRMFLGRLHRLDETLHAVITFMDERALAQAARLDAELQAGHDRGPLHGIPWGAKDLLSVAGYRTTWGSAPFEQQVIDEDAEVVRRLDAAGAVLCAKLTLGELAWGDVWFGGMTRNPWNPEQGSSGSSAGSCSAVAAGLLPFALGTETLGSIVSPCQTCGVGGLRPTFGAVSRHGAMPLSWTMDKVGAIARSAVDLGLVFDAIRGADGHDPAARDAAFAFDPAAGLDGLRIGVLAGDRTFRRDEDQRFLKWLGERGAAMKPVTLPDAPYGAMLLMLHAEAAAAFDELLRNGRLGELPGQDDDDWPNQFRSARTVPAVEYVQASRLRSKLCADVHQALAGIDVLVSPTHGGPTLTCTNLTGHPTAVLPIGSSQRDGDGGRPTVLGLIGQPFGEAAILRVAAAWQQTTQWHQQRPKLTS